MSTPTPTEIVAKNQRKAVRFFWCFLIGATVVSLVGNITHAVLTYLPSVVIQIGAAAVPPIALLAAVHGIALAVRAGASGRVYRWAIAAVAVIGAGAFVLSFRALRDLLIQTGTPPAWAWIFPAIIDTAVAVSTMMLVALGDKPARRTRTATAPASAQVKASAPTTPAPVSAPPRPHSVRAAKVASSAQSAPVDPALLAVSAPDQHADAGADHAALAQALVDAGTTTKPAAVVASILAAQAEGTALNRIASDMGIHLSMAMLKSPLVARKSPHPLRVSSVAITSLVLGVAHSVRVAVGGHQRNAKLQLTVVLAPPEVVPGLYVHPDHRRRRRRPVVRSQLDV
jgi:hypothetical protein